jgi:short-subunit dehydrogenase
MKILVTGSSRGLGKELVDCKSENEVFEHVRETDTAKVNKNVLIGDINDADFLEKLDVFIRKNKINVLVNNAGIYKNCELTKMSIREIKDIINTNLIAQILITQTCIRYFQELTEAIIINVNSLAGKYASANESVYSASKFGFYGFSKSIQLENIDSSIKFIDVFPGAIKSEMTKKRVDFENLIDPKELADLILNLLKHFKTLKVTEIEVRRNLVRDREFLDLA